MAFLFSNLIDATGASQLAEQLPTLFRLPIGGDEDFPVALLGRWPDPAAMAADEVQQLAHKRTSNWREIASNCFRSARGSSPEVRRRAIGRLVWLSEVGALTESESRKLGQVFWETAHCEVNASN